MKNDSEIRKVQNKILEIMKFIDLICRQNNIEYFIMGGTALGAVRHKGFIPWDDDLDIFMTYKEYNRFKEAFYKSNSNKYVLQEWKVVSDYLEYSKIRMNGTTFIEKAFIDEKELHQGIYIDIMILHKVPMNKFKQKIIYLESKFVTVYALSQRNWQPKSRLQKNIVYLLNLIPSKQICNYCYRNIYKYDKLDKNYMYCYWITKGDFNNGLFDKSYFEDIKEYDFEDIKLLGPSKIKEYLKIRYGDYMQLPSQEERDAAVHAYIYDTEKDYKEYL